jgi:phosphatidylglycerophosphate synthase
MAAAESASAPARVVSPFNPANAVTASRFLCLPPFVWAVDSGYAQWATLFMLICGLLDKLDGAVAKLFDCRSAFGEVFDAITDGVCYGFGMIIIVAYGWAPVIPVVIVVGLGILNSVFRFIYAKRAGKTVNYKSYAMERVVGFVAFMIGFATGQMETDFYYWYFLPIFLLSILYDAKRMLIDAVPGADR